MVVLHERHVVEVEALEQLGDHACKAGQREVGIAAHGAPVGAQRQGGHDAAVVAAQLRHHGVPHRAAHRQAAEQDEHGARPAAVLVVDDSRAQLQLRHRSLH